MKKIIYIPLLLILTILSVNSIAQQISSKVTSKFPQALTINVYNDVLSKMEFSENLQFKLASLYSKRDSLLIKKITQLTPFENLNRYSDSLLYDIEIKFKKLLTTEQQRDYFHKIERQRAVNFPIFHDTIYMNIEMDSQFGLALALFDKFNLKPMQKDSLLYYATILKQKEEYSKQNPDSGYLDKAAFESEYMAKILTEPEYNGLLSIKNKLIAESNSRNTWYKLKADHFVTALGRQDTLNQLKLFYLTKACLWDKFANQPQVRNIIVQNVAPPTILQKAFALKDEQEAKLQKYAW